MYLQNTHNLSANINSTIFPIYGISKNAVNAITILFANALKDTNILINSVNPGWVKTDMGGLNAINTIEEGVDSIVWLATLPDGGHTGGFFQNRKLITWYKHYCFESFTLPSQIAYFVAVLTLTEIPKSLVDE
jgi:NAD(P)-dependent dehydrogenase (short-subunit alcohol dehydrogenase family)